MLTGVALDRGPVEAQVALAQALLKELELAQEGDLVLILELCEEAAGDAGDQLALAHAAEQTAVEQRADQLDAPPPDVSRGRAVAGDGLLAARGRGGLEAGAVRDAGQLREVALEQQPVVLGQEGSIRVAH